jgi:hypothetical protein
VAPCLAACFGFSLFMLSRVANSFPSSYTIRPIRPAAASDVGSS